MSSNETKFEVHQPEGPNTGNARQHKHHRRMLKRIPTNRRINKENPTSSDLNKNQDSMKQYQPSQPQMQPIGFQHNQPPPIATARVVPPNQIPNLPQLKHRQNPPQLPQVNNSEQRLPQIFPKHRQITRDLNTTENSIKWPKTPTKLCSHAL